MAKVHEEKLSILTKIERAGIKKKWSAMCGARGLEGTCVQIHERVFSSLIFVIHKHAALKLE